ncbi:MAG: hypothetical protein D6B26_02425 [Spirochaetaceae bacterium]|nr:MAG: hypothetical protein D6B26_02425 [Spirochaetaceae bacterium]
MNWHLLWLIPPAALAIPAIAASHRAVKGNEYLKLAVNLSLFLAAAVYGSSTDWQGLTLPFSISLLFAAAADFLLSRQRRPWFFVAGLAGYLIAYAIYGIVLHQAAGPSWLLALAIPAMLILMALQYRKLDRLPADLRAPVITYMLTVSHLVVAAFIHAAHKWTSNPAAAVCILAGAILIYFSDSCIAHHTFGRKLAKSEIWILASYYPAQLCMLAGLMMIQVTG